MKDLIKLFKLTFKRFGVWILLLAVFAGVTASITSRGRVENQTQSYRATVAELANKMDVDFDVNKPITPEYIANARKLADSYAEKNGIEINSNASEVYEKIESSQIHQKGDDLYIKAELYAEYLYAEADLNQWKNQYDETWKVDSKATYGVYNYINNLATPVIFLVFLIAFMITSLEQSLPYYDFTMMYPWKKKDEVWMKGLIVIIIGTIMYAINLLIGILMINSSDLGQIVNFVGIWDPILKQFLNIIAFSILAVATGMIAGNFVGHIGLTIIAIGGLDLVEAILVLIVDLFSSTASSNIDQAYNNWYQSAPDFLVPFTSLLNSQETYQSLAGVILIAILWAILAYFVNSRVSAEKSGYVVISKPVELVARILGTLSLTSILYVIVRSAFIYESFFIINLVIYGLSLLISYKLFDILFKVRLKF